MKSIPIEEIRKTPVGGEYKTMIITYTLNDISCFINSLVEDIREQVKSLTLEEMDKIEDIINTKWRTER